MPSTLSILFLIVDFLKGSEESTIKNFSDKVLVFFSPLPGRALFPSGPDKAGSIPQNRFGGAICHRPETAFLILTLALPEGSMLYL
ncbi:MAG: hypothetical protein HZC18_04980 [Candidatus Omnitrophica bacterium]|nr:hypothetical protein [Candidatus Omnitrophota bacterium]